MHTRMLQCVPRVLKCAAGVLQVNFMLLRSVAWCHLKHLGLVCCRVRGMQVIQAWQKHVSANPQYACNTMRRTQRDALQHIAIHGNTGDWGLPGTRQRDSTILPQRTAKQDTLPTQSTTEQHTCQRAKQGE